MHDFMKAGLLGLHLNQFIQYDAFFLRYTLNEYEPN